MTIYPTALQSENISHSADNETAKVFVHAESTDNQLVDLVLKGDGLAFEQIFDRHKRLVAVIASRYFRRPEEIEEIIQISFAKAFVELSSFRGKYERSLSSWLVRITINACFDTLRNQKRRPERLNCDLSDVEIESLLELTADNSLIAEKALLNRDLAEKILARIPNSDRVLLQMLYSDEMTTAEVAEVLGWTKSNVKIRAWRARSAVRKVLQKFL